MMPIAPRVAPDCSPLLSGMTRHFYELGEVYDGKLCGSSHPQFMSITTGREFGSLLLFLPFFYRDVLITLHHASLTR